MHQYIQFEQMERMLQFSPFYICIPGSLIHDIGIRGSCSS
jgi:hypothetical protein